MARTLSSMTGYSRDTEYQSYIDLLPKYQKKKIEKVKPKTPFWKRAVSFLMVGETGEAVMSALEGKNPVIEYGKSIGKGLIGTGYDNRTYRDVLEKLGMSRSYLSEAMPWLYNDTGKGIKFKKGGFMDPTSTGTLGLALDILGDPKTYMAGLGLFKRFTKGLRGLTMAGKKTVKEINKEVSKRIIKKGIDGTPKGVEMLNKAAEKIGKILKSNPNKYFTGITFLGKEIIPRKAFTAAGRIFENKMGHIPVLNKVYSFSKKGIQDTFIYGADVIRQGKKIGEVAEESATRYLTKKQEIFKFINYSNEKLFNDLAIDRKAFMKVFKGADKEKMANVIRETIEKNYKNIGIETVDDKLINRLIDKFKTYNKAFYAGEKVSRKKLGQKIFEEMSGYMKHMLTPEAKKMKAVLNVNITKKQSWRAWSTQSEKGRTLMKWVDDVGKDVGMGTKESLNIKKLTKKQYKKAIKGLDDAPDKLFKDSAGKIVRPERTMTITEINKMMASVMKEAGFEGKKFLVTDPFEIVLARGIESNRKIANFNFINDISTEYGRISKNLIGYYDEAGIKYIDPKIAEIPKGTLLPNFIVKDMKKATKFINDEEFVPQLLKGYDKLMRFWKGSVYGWYPASHGRNYIGGSFNNFLANSKWVKFVDRVNDISRGDPKKIIKLNNVNYTAEFLQDQIAKLDILGQTGFLDVNRLNKTFNKSFFNSVEKLPIRAMEMVENNLRVPLFLAEVDDGKSFKEAAKTVFKYHFDYSPHALTNVERNVLKRFIPFYKWNRENIPLMVEEMIAQPAKMSSFFKSMRNMVDKEGNLMSEVLPEFYSTEFPITRGGTTKVSFGLPPLEMLKYLGEPKKALISGLTPVIKAPIEMTTNFNSFKNIYF